MRKKRERNEAFSGKYILRIPKCYGNYISYIGKLIWKLRIITSFHEIFVVLTSLPIKLKENDFFRLIDNRYIR
jgi:hypothetical protein